MIDPHPDPMRCHVCNIDLDPAEDDPEVHYCSVECAIGNEDDTEEFGLIQMTAQPWDAERGRDSDGCWSWIVTIPGWSPVPKPGQQALDPARWRAQAAPGDGLGPWLVVALRWPPRVRDTRVMMAKIVGRPSQSPRVVWHNWFSSQAAQTP